MADSISLIGTPFTADLSDQVRSVSREDLEKGGAGVEGASLIIMPRALHPRIEFMTKKKANSEGFLVATVKKSPRIVFDIYSIIELTNSYFHLTHDAGKRKKIILAAKEAVKDKKSLRFIDFTVHARGREEFNHFSTREAYSFAFNQSRNPAYIHVLFTPFDVVTYGRYQGSTPQFLLGPDYEQIDHELNLRFAESLKRYRHK